jgi:UDP-N-acetylglucosamine 4,6-dehydratase
MDKETERTILVTGGTGSFGRAFISRILNEGSFNRVVVFSRDELKQWEMQQQYPKEEYPQLRFFLGDIRDAERLKRALRGVDIVVHAAALKQVPAAEYNPMEFINTNVIGAENLVNACLESKVRKVVALSTDKAAAPINLYGATKLCSDKLFLAANNIRGDNQISFTVVRYGNVMGSRGSVIPFFIREANSKRIIPITDTRMTRFNISLDESVNMVLLAIENTKGGEILVPKIPSYRITDLVEAIGPSCKKEVVGLRPGEKIHEEMITVADSYSTVDLGSYYSIYHSREELLSKYPSTVFVDPGFSYDSGSNKEFLSVIHLRELIKQHVDKTFTPV